MSYTCTLCGERAFISLAELRAHRAVAHRDLDDTGEPVVVGIGYPETDRPEPEPGPVFSPDEEAHVTRPSILPADAQEQILELADILARADESRVGSGARRLDYPELAGIALGYLTGRRSRSRSDARTRPDVSVPPYPRRTPGDAPTAADPDETSGGTG